MAKFYIKSRFRNLKELEEEQEKLRQYRKSSGLGTGIDGGGMNLLSGAVNVARSTVGSEVGEKAGLWGIAWQLGKGFIKGKGARTILKGAIGGWLKWQLIGMGIKGGEYLIKRYRRKKQEEKSIAQAQEDARKSPQKWVQGLLSGKSK